MLLVYRMEMFTLALSQRKNAWIELTSRSLTQQPFLYRVVVLDAGTRSAQLAGPVLLPGKRHRTEEGPDGHLVPALPGAVSSEGT